MEGSREGLNDSGQFDHGRNVNIFTQTKILTRKNWTTKRRTELKKLIGVGSTISLKKQLS